MVLNLTATDDKRDQAEYLREVIVNDSKYHIRLRYLRDKPDMVRFHVLTDIVRFEYAYLNRQFSDEFTVADLCNTVRLLDTYVSEMED